LILFLVMVSLLAYTRITLHASTITRGLQTSATPRAVPVPTPNSSWQALPSPSSPEADNTATYVQVQGKAYIYMNGGYRGPKNIPHYDRGLYRYNIASAHWEMLTNTDAPAMVNNAAAVDEQGHLFFTVGYSPDVYAVSSLLYEYQPAQRTFQKIVPPGQMPIGFGGSMIADQQGHLYITQGFMQAGNPHTIAGTGWYRYDIATGQWHQLASLPLGLGYVVLVPDGEGNILLLGGAVDAGQHQPTTHVYRYNIALNSWTLASTTAPFTFSGAASCLNGQGHLIIIGGYNATHTASLNTVWQVDLHTLRWTPLAPLPNGGSLLGTAACDGHGHVFLVRGANNPAQPTTDFLELTIPSR
jgi:N-acetylneuraminic acid mutarotase